MLVSAGGTKVRGRIKGVEAFMTMTARTAVPIKVKPNVLWVFFASFFLKFWVLPQALGAPFALRTWPSLHYLEAKITGNVFGMSVGLIAGSVENLDTWFPDHSVSDVRCEAPRLNLEKGHMIMK